MFLLWVAPVGTETPANDINVPGPDGFVLHPVLSDPDPKAAGSCSIVRIDVSHRGHLFQTLHPHANTPLLDPNHPRDLSQCIRCDDCNFDGHPDLVFVDSVGALANTSTQVWLYDPHAQRFGWSSSLSNPSHLEVDSKHRVLTSGGRSEAGLEAEAET
jgi:hypothetical protein